MPVQFLVLWLTLVSLACASPWAVTDRISLPAPDAVDFRRIELRSGEKPARLHVVTFSTQTHTFALMDDPANAYDLASAARKRGAVAAVNGGYFKPDRTPLGLRVRQGKEIHPYEKARLLSGLLTVTGDRCALVRVGEFRRGAHLREAVQCGPFLVDGGKPVSGLNDVRSAARTVIITDGGSRFGLATSSSVTLAELGQIFATAGVIPNFTVSRALNLDGGSSTGMWVAGSPPFYARELRNVRDFVGIVAR